MSHVRPLLARLEADVAPWRRNITTAQKAMGYALLFPDPAKGGRGKTVPSGDGFSRQSLSKACAVLAFPEWADEVTEGAPRP